MVQLPTNVDRLIVGSTKKKHLELQSFINMAAAPVMTGPIQPNYILAFK